MNNKIREEDLDDLSAFYKDGVLETTRLKYLLEDRFSNMIQKHNGVIAYLGDSHKLKTTNKNDMVSAINEVDEESLKYALVFGM